MHRNSRFLNNRKSPCTCIAVHTRTYARTHSRSSLLCKRGDIAFSPGSRFHWRLTKFFSRLYQSNTRFSFFSSFSFFLFPFAPRIAKFPATKASSSRERRARSSHTRKAARNSTSRFLTSKQFLSVDDVSPFCSQAWRPKQSVLITRNRSRKNSAPKWNSDSRFGYGRERIAMKPWIHLLSSRGWRSEWYSVIWSRHYIR